MGIGIIGAGFVGTTTAVRAAELGHRVRLVENDPVKRHALASGTLPFHEEGVEPALREALDNGRLTIAENLAEDQPLDLVLFCVGTPPNRVGRADLDQLAVASRQTARVIERWAAAGAPDVVVAVKSTVPPGTTRQVLGETMAELAPSATVHLGMTPEFLQEGRALEDARHPSRVVIGAADGEATDALRSLYGELRCPVLETDLETAETTKYVVNGLLASKVAFANEVGNLCEALGLHVDEVMEGVGMDPRISPGHLQAGCGFGGSCFPKDLAELAGLAQEHGVRLSILQAALENNRSQPLRVVEHARRLVGDLVGKRVALLGLAFKPGTSDVRESRAIVIHDALVDAGCEVRCWDPEANAEFKAATVRPTRVFEDWQQACRNADVVVVQTAWPELRSMTPEELAPLVRAPRLIDTRRALDADAFVGAGFQYVAFGVGDAALVGRARRQRRRRSEATIATASERTEPEAAATSDPMAREVRP